MCVSIPFKNLRQLMFFLEFSDLDHFQDGDVPPLEAPKAQSFWRWFLWPIISSKNSHKLGKNGIWQNSEEIFSRWTWEFGKILGALQNMPRYNVSLWVQCKGCVYIVMLPGPAFIGFSEQDNFLISLTLMCCPHCCELKQFD